MTREDLIGTWRLENFVITDANGEERPQLARDDAGILIYAPDGYMMVTTRIAGTPGNYAGAYELGEDFVVHRVEMSSNPALVGTEQRRYVTLGGGRLTLSGRPSMRGGPGSTSNLIWRRAEAGG